MSRTNTFEAMLARGQDGEMLRYTLGRAYLDEGDPGRAVEHLERAVELKPGWSAAWRSLGRARAAAGDHLAALDAFDRGAEAAAANGDVQIGKEIDVFRRRSSKALAARAGGTDGADEADGPGASDPGAGDGEDRA